MQNTETDIYTLCYDVMSIN